MSAPVLSWLFTAHGKPRKAFLVRQFSPCTNPLSTERRQVASAQLEHQNKDPYTQPSEPILQTISRQVPDKFQTILRQVPAGPPARPQGVAKLRNCGAQSNQHGSWQPHRAPVFSAPNNYNVCGGKQIRKTQDEPQWIVAQRLLSALTIPGFSYVVCKRFITSKV